MRSLGKGRPSGRLIRRSPILGLVALVLVAACHKEKKAAVEGGGSPVSVSIMAPESAGKTREVAVAGVVRGIHEADLTARVNGQVERIAVHLGQRVEKGQLLLQLSGDTFASQVTKARAALSYARTNFSRIDRLFKDGSASRSEWDQAKQDLDVAQAEEKGAVAKFSWTRIVAPFPGWIANKAVRKGDVVLPGAPLLSVIDASRLQVLSHVPDALVGELKIGLGVRFEVNGRQMTGRIKDLSPSSDPTTHTVTVKVLLEPLSTTEEAPVRLPGIHPVNHIVGMYGKLSIPVRGTPGLFVPEGAVIDHEGLREIYVVTQGHAELRYVRTGRRINGKIEILSGLSANEMIVAAPPVGLADGMAVRETAP